VLKRDDKAREYWYSHSPDITKTICYAEIQQQSVVRFITTFMMEAFLVLLAMSSALHEQAFCLHHMVLM